MSNKNFKIGVYDKRYNDFLGAEFPELDIVQSEGLRSHIVKRHPGCLKYLDNIEEIITSPDYIGMNPKESKSFELIKKYEDNVLVAIKLDIKNDYYYVATLHDIKQSKIDNRLYSGRLKKFTKPIDI